MSHEDTLRDAAVDYRHDTEHAYEQSDQYLADALQWCADFGHEDAVVVAVARVAYRQSPVFDAVVDDALDGERRF